MQPLPNIETPRTLLTILQPDNAHLMLAYHMENKAHLAPWEPARADDFYSLESFLRRGEKSHSTFIDGTAVNFIAIDRPLQKVVAACSFTNIVRGPFLACNMGYSVAKEFEGKGLMQEVASHGIRYMFDVAGLHRIMANHFPSNTRSEQLLEALGFKREGYAKAYLKIAGQWEDMILNSLINPNE